MYRVQTGLTGIPGAPYYSRFYYSSIGGKIAQDAADATVAWWTAVDNLFANDLTWTVDATVETVDETTGLITATTAVTGGTGSGADSTSYLPPSNQALLRMRTNQFNAGRELRGRVFVPGLTEASTADGLLDSTWVNSFNTASATLVGDADAELVVYSPTHHAYASVTSMTVWTSIAVLRSRRD